MAERTTIARPYADAAFDFAREGNALAQWGGMLTLADSIATDPRMVDALSSPKLSGEEKAALFLSIGGERFSPPMGNYIRILIEADRISLLPEIRALYEALRDDAEGIARATIETAMPLTAEQTATLTTALERRFGRKVETTVRINPALIGGARVSVGDTVIDGSVQAKLLTMANALRT